MYYYSLPMVLTKKKKLKPKSLIHKEPHLKSVRVKFSKEKICKYNKLEQIRLKAYSLKRSVIEML